MEDEKKEIKKEREKTKRREVEDQGIKKSWQSFFPTLEVQQCSRFPFLLRVYTAVMRT